jgi:ribonuclease D
MLDFAMEMIADAGALDRLVESLRGVDAIGVDTEADSFHSYREKTCLLQISTRDGDYIVDPLALQDLSPLAEVFADPKVCKVFHAADNDVAGLRRDFRFSTKHLFDTMTAARILGLPRVGLGDLLREHFGVETNKRFQRHDWGRRPLDATALDYAAIDSRYLLPLRERMRTALEAAGRTEEAEDEFRRLQESSSRERLFDPDGFWRIKGSYGLEPRQRAVLRELFIWRDSQASALDRPPFRVAPDAVLLALATTMPGTPAELNRVEGLPDGIARRFAPAMLSAVRRGAAAPAPLPPPPRRFDEAAVERFESLRGWRKGIAARRGVDPDVIVSNATLQAVAEHQPRSLADLESLGVLGAWKLRSYGAGLIEALSTAQDGGRIRSSKAGSTSSTRP